LISTYVPTGIIVFDDREVEDRTSGNHGELHGKPGEGDQRERRASGLSYTKDDSPINGTFVGGKEYKTQTMARIERVWVSRTRTRGVGGQGRSRSGHCSSVRERVAGGRTLDRRHSDPSPTTLLHPPDSPKPSPSPYHSPSPTIWTHVDPCLSLAR
jgi:hypothetical protein